MHMPLAHGTLAVVFNVDDPSLCVCVCVCVCVVCVCVVWCGVVWCVVWCGVWCGVVCCVVCLCVCMCVCVCARECMHACVRAGVFLARNSCLNWEDKLTRPGGVNVRLQRHPPPTWGEPGRSDTAWGWAGSRWSAGCRCTASASPWNSTSIAANLQSLSFLIGEGEGGFVCFIA